MTNPTTTSPMTLVPSLEAAWRDVDSSFERFCLTAGIGSYAGIWVTRPIRRRG